MLAEMAANAIDPIIDRLTEIVGWARDRENRIGYFAAMYRRVTISVKEAIEAGEFEDAARMTRLDVAFAQRYIDAFEQFEVGGEPTSAWRVSFDATAKRRPVIIQQLLTGMNAHINLDLGIAAATVCPGAELGPLERDFIKINEVLARMIDGLVADVAEVSPWIGIINRFRGAGHRLVIKFSIDVARVEAWKLANELAPLPRTGWPDPMRARDDWTAGFGKFLLRPGWLLSAALLIVRVRESNDVRRVIDVLSGG